LLAFLDADGVPAPDWLDRLEEGMTGEDDAVAGSMLNGTPGSLVGTAEYLLEFSEVLPHRRRPLDHAPTCNLLVRRERFEAAGGFPTDLRAGEDTVFTFPLAAEGRLVFAPGATVRHLNRTGIGPFLANQRRLGAAFVQVGRRVAFPHRWVCRGPLLVFAVPLRAAALARCLRGHPAEAVAALRALPLLLVGLGAWLIGAIGALADRDRTGILTVPGDLDASTGT
jgi:cellulose synthase/poly-beta-1,6-N-acetylglucosamine synthase-like glycosyltransferase